MSEGKKNIIAALLEEYDIQDTIKDLLCGTIQDMMEYEIDEPLGYKSYGRSDSPNARNDKKPRVSEVNMEKWKLKFPKIRKILLP